MNQTDLTAMLGSKNKLKDEYKAKKNPQKIAKLSHLKSLLPTVSNLAGRILCQVPFCSKLSSRALAIVL